jgi:exosortase/archaeosortase family protein
MARSVSIRLGDGSVLVGNSEDGEPVSTRPRPLWVVAGVFVLTSATLQWAWAQARGTSIERAVIDSATVRTAVTIINAVTPDFQAQAVGSRIRAPGGGINVLNGCEGTEVLFLLVAALLACPLNWRTRVVGLLAGTAFVFLANQVRLLALFYSYQLNRDLFDQLHGLVMPLVLIAMTTGFFALLMQWDARGRTKPNCAT